jgi:hypothetical protein
LVAEAARFPGADLVYSNVDPTTLSRLTQALEQANSDGSPTDAPPAADHP